MAMMMTTIMTMIPTPMHCIDISIANVVGVNFLFLLMATRETATAVMTTMMMKMTTTTMTTTTVMMMTTTMMMTFPKLTYHLWLQVVTPPLLLIAPFMEMILIGPVVIPILSNQVVTEMLSVAAMTLMSCFIIFGFKW
jgi:formate-dependent nitrite reductase membrane component NrfD